MKMKRLTIVTTIMINVLSAGGFILLGDVALLAHRTHSYSMFREFVSKGLIDERQVESVSHSSNRYDMVQRMRAIGNVEGNFRLISRGAATICILNAMAIYLFYKPTAASQKAGPHPKDQRND